jgi:anaerobic selenocysteine-containing dehydrogenase
MTLSRRGFLKLLGGTAALAALGPFKVSARPAVVVDWSTIKPAWVDYDPNDTAEDLVRKILAAEENA